MSLVSNEGEGEQNEIRNLQDKLNTTMKLVSHLTSQLNELKEQVLNTFKSRNTRLWQPAVLTKTDTNCKEQEAEPAQARKTSDTKRRAPAAIFGGFGDTWDMCFLILNLLIS